MWWLEIKFLGFSGDLDDLESCNSFWRGVNDQGLRQNCLMVFYISGEVVVGIWSLEPLFFSKLGKNDHRDTYCWSSSTSLWELVVGMKGKSRLEGLTFRWSEVGERRVDRFGCGGGRAVSRFWLSQFVGAGFWPRDELESLEQITRSKGVKVSEHFGFASSLFCSGFVKLETEFCSKI